MTSRDPPFRRDDVADRTLVFRVARVEDFIGMGDYLRQITDYRDLLWSAYLDNLQDILVEYLERDTGTMSSSHRMADWAIFAQIIADALNIDDVDELLETMETERAAFALENEQWAAAIAKWVRNNPDEACEWQDAGTLADNVGEAVEGTSLTFTLSSRGIGSKTSTYSNELAEVFGLEIDSSRRTNRYRFVVDGGGEDGDGGTDDGMPVGFDRF